MAAAGLRGVALDGGDDGLTLAVKTDAMTVHTASDAVSEAGRQPGGGRGRGHSAQARAGGLAAFPARRRFGADTAH